MFPNCILQYINFLNQTGFFQNKNFKNIQLKSKQTIFPCNYAETGVLVWYKSCSKKFSAQEEPLVEGVNQASSEQFHPDNKSWFCLRRTLDSITISYEYSILDRYYR